MVEVGKSVGVSFRWNDSELDSALDECHRTHRRGGGSRHDLDYLRARFLYHKLMVARGLLNPRFAEPDPDAR